MTLDIRKLTPELADDYFDLFDNRAFTDDSPYRCYCQVYQMSKEQQKEAIESFQGDDYGLLWKNVARKQIETGALRGYLAYAEGQAVGWCNANDRANYPSEPCVDVLYHSPIPQQEMAVVCFEIAPGFRGRGIATALLNRVIADAALSGYTSVFAFPVLRSERFEWDCTGPIHMYEKAGFVRVLVQDEIVVMQKRLV